MLSFFFFGATDVQSDMDKVQVLFMSALSLPVGGGLTAAVGDRSPALSGEF